MMNVQILTIAVLVFLAWTAVWYVATVQLLNTNIGVLITAGFWLSLWTYSGLAFWLIVGVLLSFIVVRRVERLISRKASH